MNIRHTPRLDRRAIRPLQPCGRGARGFSASLYISGEVGVLPNGSVPETMEAQAEACWQNIIAILADAGMTVADLV